MEGVHVLLLLENEGRAMLLIKLFILQRLMLIVDADITPHGVLHCQALGRGVTLQEDESNLLSGHSVVHIESAGISVVGIEVLTEHSCVVSRVEILAHYLATTLSEDRNFIETIRHRNGNDSMGDQRGIIDCDGNGIVELIISNAI